MTIAKYWRDAFGHRAVKDVGGNRTVFLNFATAQLEAYDLPTATASSTIYEPGIDRPVAEVAGNGDVTFYQQDWLGNVAMLTSGSGAKIEGYSYDPWGGFTATDSSGTPVATPKSRLLFTAREFDSETRLYHYRARTYCPKLGRFLQTDPIDFDAGDVNLFRYVLNNPANWIDPLGLDIWNINNSRAVGGNGHSGAIVGQPGGNRFTYDSFGPDKPGMPLGKGNLDQKSFNSLDEAMDYAKKQGYDRYAQFESDCEGDNAAREEAKKWADDDYNGTSHNCQDMVNSMMGAAGIPYIGPSHPNMAFNKNLPLSQNHGPIN